jgi:hypothetical protein
MRNRCFIILPINILKSENFRVLHSVGKKPHDVHRPVIRCDLYRTHCIRPPPVASPRAAPPFLRAPLSRSGWSPCAAAEGLEGGTRSPGGVAVTDRPRRRSWSRLCRGPRSASASSASRPNYELKTAAPNRLCSTVHSLDPCRGPRSASNSPGP